MRAVTMIEDLPVRRQCIGNAVDEAASTWAGAIGWTFEDQPVSFLNMREEVDRIAKSLLSLGVSPGDIVAALLPNRFEIAATMFACAKIGAVLTSLNTRSKQFELEHGLGHSEARILITTDNFLNQDFLGMIGEIAGADALTHGGAVRSATLPKLKHLVGARSAVSPMFMPWAEFLALGADVPDADLADVQAARVQNEPVVLQYTSGTTALPKGALLNHVFVLNYAVPALVRLGLKAGDAFLNTQPLYHAGGLCGAVPSPLTIGFNAVIPDFYEPRRVLSLIERERCVARSGFAAMYLMEMDDPDFAKYDLSSLRAGWCVGAPELMQKVYDQMGITNLIQLYGSTEVAGTCGSLDEPWDKRKTTCGKIFPEMEIATFDAETGKRQPPGMRGEIALRGWASMNGYFKQPEATAKTIDAEGWVHTGDYGEIDEDGYLHFGGRLKNMIRVGGENVSAEEVEAMLLRHPKIRAAAVIPAPDDRLEEVVCAIVELQAGEEASSEEIIAYCKPRMANFRVPRIVHFIAEWPMTGSGKIQKHVLVETYGGKPTVLAHAEEAGELSAVASQ